MYYQVDCRSIHWKSLEELTLVINIDSGFYYTFNEMGTAVWNHCAAGYSFEQIVNSVQIRCQVNCDTLVCDLTQFCNDIIREGLLSVADDSFQRQESQKCVDVFVPLPYQTPEMKKYERLYELGVGS